MRQQTNSQNYFQFQFADLEGETSNNESNLAANEFAVNCNQKKASVLYAVLYTSGSTGRPKGARITHKATFNRFEAQTLRDRLSVIDRDAKILP